MGGNGKYSTLVNFKYMVPGKIDEARTLLKSGRLYLHKAGERRFCKGRNPVDSYLILRGGNDSNIYSDNSDMCMMSMLAKNRPEAAGYREGTLIDCWSFSAEEAEFARKLFEHLKSNTDFAGFVSSKDGLFPELFGTNRIRDRKFVPYMSEVPLIGSLVSEDNLILRSPGRKRRYPVNQMELHLVV